MSVHVSDTAPWRADEPPPGEEAQLSYWRLFWRRFRRHRLAVIAAAVLALLYGTIPFTEILAPYAPETRHVDHIHAPPQLPRLLHEGRFIGPFVYGLTGEVDLATFQRRYTADTARIHPVGLFCRGDEYRLWGLIAWDVHLLCARPDEAGNPGTLFLLGTDRLGRDMASLILYGARISLTIGLVGVALSFLIGVTLGGLAGYLGGLIDRAVMRLIEFVRSLPEVPLWLALSAALPVTWPPLFVYFGITLILALLDWPGLARAVRARMLALREEDFATAAVLAGASRARVVFRHLLPNMTSHLIASVTLSIPAMILGETALSFLGLGLQAPVISWGVLLNDAQNLTAIEVYPWLLAPVVPVVVTVLAFNLMGDGLRDAADPYR